MKYTKGSFIIVPNIEHISQLKTISQLVFLWLCKYANEDGVCFPAMTSLARLSRTSRRSVLYAISELEEKSFITRKNQVKNNMKTANLYQINLLPALIEKDETLDAQEVRNDAHIGHGGSAPGAHRTISKELDSNTAKVPFAGEIVEIIESFKTVNPSYKKYFGNKTQRSAVTRLLKEHGKEKLLEMISVLPHSNSAPYAPTITTPLQLEDNLGKLIAWAKKNDGLKKSSKVAFS